jgi:long-chain acyl-CoA synthetase
VAVVQPDEWQRVAPSLGLDPQDAASLHPPAVQRPCWRASPANTASFARYAVPRAVHLVTLEPWTIENTMMTPTLKLKRNNLLARHAAAIEAMYQRPGAR